MLNLKTEITGTIGTTTNWWSNLTEHVQRCLCLFVQCESHLFGYYAMGQLILAIMRTIRTTTTTWFSSLIHLVRRCLLLFVKRESAPRNTFTQSNLQKQLFAVKYNGHLWMTHFTNYELLENLWSIEFISTVYTLVSLMFTSDKGPLGRAAVSSVQTWRQQNQLAMHRSRESDTSSRSFRTSSLKRRRPFADIEKNSEG